MEYLNPFIDGDEVRDDEIEKEGSDVEGEGGDDDGKEIKEQKYIKKEYFARPYISPHGTDDHVKSLIVRNQR